MSEKKTPQASQEAATTEPNTTSGGPFGKTTGASHGNRTTAASTHAGTSHTAMEGVGIGNVRERVADVIRETDTPSETEKALQQESTRLAAQIEVHLADIQRLRAANDAMLPLVQQAMATLRAL